MKEKNINDKKNLIDKVNDFFDKLIEPEKIKEENIDENNEKKEEKHEILKGAKINNIFLLVSYISFSEKENIDIDNILSELILKDNEEIKKTIISEMLGSDEVKEIKEIIFYLNELNSGIGENLLMNLLFANEEIEEKEKEEKKNNIIKYIKEKLFGLIIVEIKGNEEIFRLDNSFKNLIEEFINEKQLIDEEKKKQIKFNVLKNYCYLFRNVLKNYQTENEGFHACVPNNFWFNKKISSDLMDEESNIYIFHRTLDSINIYNIINNINIDDYKNDNDLQLYIDDISISLPTLLYFTNNIYYEYLIISLFEKLFEYLKEENDTKINELILRLGIFKYWVSKNPNFFQKSLELAGISDENNINLNKEAKFEYYLSKIFDCIIKKNKNIEQFSYECKRILEEEKLNDKELNVKRLNNLCSQALNKIDYNPKNTFYFLLQNPLECQFKTKSNRNFYLTQKLLTILPSSYSVEFKTLENKDKLKENENNLKDIRFLYLEYNNEKLFDFFKKSEKMNIKILILGYLDDKIYEDVKKWKNKKIKNIIYISNKEINFVLNDQPTNYDKSYFYYFQNYFIEFIHEFVSLITSKYNYCSISEAFNKAKSNFISEFSKMFDSKESIKKVENMLNLESAIEDDTFEIEYVNEEEDLNNQQKIINDIYDEYEFEYNKLKNIYYRKNPFSESSDNQLAKTKFRKFMKLPGIDYLNPKNFVEFSKKGIYDMDKNVIEKIFDLFETDNIINICGKNLVFDLADELGKYFYMSEKFKSGIYIVSPRNIEEELDSLTENIQLNLIEEDKNNNKILILFTSLNIKDEETDIKNAIKHLEDKINGLKFIICSEVEFKLKNKKFRTIHIEKSLISVY